MSIRRPDTQPARENGIGDEVAGLSLRGVEAFRATLRSGSVSAAARLLGVSQPAISQHLKQLEQAGGVRLFDRRLGRLLPTAEAQLLLAEVERVFSGLEQVRRRLLALRSHASATLHVGCLHATSMGLVPRAAARFLARHAGARVELQVSSSNALRDALADGALDLAILADESDVRGLNASVFYELPGVCLLPQAHRLARKRLIGPRDLHDEAFITLARGDRTRERIDAVLATHGVVPRTVVETPYGATQCALVGAGVGIALVNPIVAHDLASQPGVAMRPFEPTILFRALLGFAPGRALGAMQQAFVAECRAELAALSSVRRAARQRTR